MTVDVKRYSVVLPSRCESVREDFGSDMLKKLVRHIDAESVTAQNLTRLLGIVETSNSTVTVTYTKGAYKSHHKLRLVKLQGREKEKQQEKNKV